MEKSGVIVEFFGLPGSGKSTIAAMVSSKLAEEGFYFDNCLCSFMGKPKLIKALYKIFILVVQFINSPVCFIRQVKKLVDTHQNSIKDLVRIIAQYFLIVYAMQQARRKNRRIILDEGIYHFILSVCLNSQKQLHIEDLLAQVEKPDFVVLLKINEEVMRERLIKRNRKNRRFDKYVCTGNSHKIKRMMISFENVEEHLNNKNARMITIDNNHNCGQELIGMISKAIMALYYEV